MNTICLSENANTILKEFLKKKGCHLIEIKRTDAVYDAVSSHGDIYLCKIQNELIISQEQLPFIRKELLQCNVSFTSGSSPLGQKYPENIRYNAAQMGDCLIHNSKYTDPQILIKAKERNLKRIHVNQGYTKCNLVIVDDNSVITSDEGVAGVLKNQGIDTLLICKGHVKLFGLPYGFLGGASGRVGSEIIFNGDLSAHPDFNKIIEFIQDRGLQAAYFKEYPLEDIGSIIQI